MKKNTTIYILATAALITIIGLVTGWYFFIFLVLPLGFLFKGKNKE